MFICQIWHNFVGPFLSNNGTHGTQPLLIYIVLSHFKFQLCTIIGTFTYSVAYRNSCTFSRKLVNQCASNGSFLCQFLKKGFVPFSAQFLSVPKMAENGYPVACRNLCTFSNQNGKVVLCAKNDRLKRVFCHCCRT